MTKKSGFIVLVLAFPLIGFASSAGAQELARAADPTGTVESLARIPLVAAREKGITAEQLANVKERIALAMAILDRLAPEAESMGLQNGWRQPRLESLLQLPLSGLRAVQGSSSLAGLTEAVNTQMIEPQAIGDPAADLVFTPVTPCRYIDTRNVGGKISGSRGYNLLSNGSTYGGSAACAPETIFAAAENQIAAIAMNVVVVAPDGAPGFAAVKPNLAAPISALVNWYEAGANVTVGNQGVVTMDQTGAADEFFIESSTGTHVVVDFFGAFVEPQATAVEQNILLTQQNVLANVGFTIVSPPCPAGWGLTGGGHFSSSFDSPAFLATSRPVMGLSGALVSGINSADRWIVQGTNSSTAQNMGSFAICSRIPGR